MRCLVGLNDSEVQSLGFECWSGVLRVRVFSCCMQVVCAFSKRNRVLERSTLGINTLFDISSAAMPFLCPFRVNPVRAFYHIVRKRPRGAHATRVQAVTPLGYTMLQIF